MRIALGRVGMAEKLLLIIINRIIESYYSNLRQNYLLFKKIMKSILIGFFPGHYFYIYNKRRFDLKVFIFFWSFEENCNLQLLVA